jgi:CDP-glycerol glycerophosphotransferase (TagB/SpsB family)
MEAELPLVGTVHGGLRRIAIRVLDEARSAVDGTTARSRVDLLCLWAQFVVIERVSPLWGRDDDLWVFGARGGSAFVDNAKYLYLWVNANEPSVRAIWLTKRSDVARTLQRHGYEAYTVSSLRGIALSLRAGVVFVTQGLRDVNMGCSGGAALVQLWHGIPLKTVGWDAERSENPGPIRYVHRYVDERMDLVTVPTEATIEPLSSGLGIDPDRFVATGYPRNDSLAEPIAGQTIGVDESVVAEIEARASEGAVILYLPTFRDDGESFVEWLDVERVGALLGERDAHMFVKPHPDEPVSSDDAVHPRIHWIPSTVEPYPILPHADVLLTDYSSIFFDYLHLDRPIVFFPYDFRRYVEKRGLYFGYDAVTPGPKATDAAELLDHLGAAIDSIGDADDPYAEDRARIRERFCAPTAGDGAASVCRAVRRRLLQRRAVAVGEADLKASVVVGSTSHRPVISGKIERFKARLCERLGGDSG